MLDASLRRCGAHLAAARAFTALIALLYLAPTIYMMQVYDRVIPTHGMLTLVFMSAALLFALAVHSVLEGARQRLLIRASLRLSDVLGVELVRNGFRERSRSGPRSTQILREFDIYRASLHGPGAIGMMDLPYAPLFIIVAFMLHPWLGGLILGGALLLVGIALLGERAEKRETEAAAERGARMYASAEVVQMFAGAVRALGMQGALSKRIVDDRRDVNEQQVLNAFVSARYAGWIRLLRMVLQSASLGLGAYLAIQQELSPGALIAASVLAGRALAPIEQVVGAWRQIGLAAAAKKTLVQFLDGAPEEVERTPLPAPAGKLLVEAVSARAPGEDRVVLAGVSFAMDAGESLGVIGASGSGKSTLARLLVGAQRADDGAVRLDGSNIVDWDPDALGRHIGYLPQDTALLPGTIGENIRRFLPAEQNGESAVAAAQAAGVHAMVQRLPKGYDTMLGLRGEGISAGQAQRVALARALFGSPRLLVLDEPNAHLDSEGDAMLLTTLSAAKARGATVIVMTHRTGVLAAVDKLLVLREGRVERFGPRDEILTELRKAAASGSQMRVVASGQGTQ